MREKKEKLVVSFLTTTQAMAAEKYCLKNQIPGRIIPLPSEISAECGIAWCTEPEEEEIVPTPEETAVSPGQETSIQAETGR